MTTADYVFVTVAVLLAFGAGVVIGYRRGVRHTWLVAALAFIALDRSAMVQLRRAEDVATAATEREHDLIRNPRYVPRTPYDSPARPVGVTANTNGA